jgi:uncharacterized membrane protein YphA (DoxX/SURF4 family)
MASSNKVQTILYWITTVVVAVAFIIPGIGNLIRAPHIAQEMAHLGYPGYFLTILGTWKILGAITILIPDFKRIKEWAYAGMIFDLTGAAVSRFSSGDEISMWLIPLLIVCVAITSWALRPRKRKLE